MTTQFELRALAEQLHAELGALLDRAAGGDGASFDAVRRRARAALDDSALQRRNARSSVLRLWRDWLDGAVPSPDAVVRLAEIAVAVCCMPEFQLAAAAGDERASTLVVLGDEDGGLFGIVTAHVPWFEPWLEAGLRHRAERHGYGRAMFRMSPDDRARLAAALGGLDAHCDAATSPVHCRDALARLAGLLRLADRTPGRTIAVCETG